MASASGYAAARIVASSARLRRLVHRELMLRAALSVVDEALAGRSVDPGRL